jgi:hypothetical protein
MIFTASIPYTYLIGWSKLNTWYYGVRYANRCHPEELWRTYFTSSKYVKEFREIHGNPDVITVRHTFTDTTRARLWEYRVLKRIKASHRNDFLNRTDNKSIAPKYGNDNPATRPDVRAKICKALKGKPHSDEHRMKNRASHEGKNNGMYGRRHSTTTRDKISTAKKGKPGPGLGKNYTEELKQKIRESIKALPKIKCNHCGGLYHPNNHKRWHDTNCKSRAGDLQPDG